MTTTTATKAAHLSSPPPDLMKRFVAAPFTAWVATSTDVYRVSTNYFPLCEGLCDQVEVSGPLWDCTIIHDSEYPMDDCDAMSFSSHGQCLVLQPGRLIAVDGTHRHIVAFLSLEPDQTAVRALLQEIIWLCRAYPAHE